MMNIFRLSPVRSILIVAVLLPISAHAASVGDLIDATTELFMSFIPILLSLAVLAFFWGLVKFINHADDEKAVEEGKMMMVWGMIAIFVMVALWGILGWLQQETGLDGYVDLGTLPAIPDVIP